MAILLLLSLVELCLNLQCPFWHILNPPTPTENLWLMQHFIHLITVLYMTDFHSVLLPYHVLLMLIW